MKTKLRDSPSRVQGLPDQVCAQRQRAQPVRAEGALHRIAARPSVNARAVLLRNLIDMSDNARLKQAGEDLMDDLLASSRLSATVARLTKDV